MTHIDCDVFCMLVLGYWKLEDCPPGHSEQVTFLKQDNGCLCKRCFYVKRGSCGNMRVSELVTHMENNEDFKDKPHPQLICKHGQGWT